MDIAVLAGTLLLVNGIIAFLMSLMARPLARFQARLWNRSYSERQEKYLRIVGPIYGVISILLGLFFLFFLDAVVRSL